MKVVLSRYNKNIVIVISMIVLVILLMPTNPLLIDIVKKPDGTLKSLPDFSKIKEVKEKKTLFFETLYPIIEEENNHILALRSSVLALKNKASIDKDETQWLLDLSKYVKIKHSNINEHFYAELLKRVDFIPPSLALTQAAIESGWGTSRFSKEGNNIFGQWCFQKGCGVVPSARDEGKDHEVAKFSTVNSAVSAYLRNLNSNQSYTGLWEIRKELRVKQNAMTGVALAKGLMKYSEEGLQYVNKVKVFIIHNKLEEYNKQFEIQLNKVQ